jgi:hypothetical protein
MSVAGMALMPAILLEAAASGPAFETAAPAVAPSAAIASAIRTPTAAAVSTATAERPLETRTRIAAHARGLAREFLP